MDIKAKNILIILKYKMLNLDDIVSNKKENKDTSSSERNN